MKIWEKPNKFQKISISLALTFLTLTHILTWYGITHQGLVEADVPVARLIQMYGAPIGLSINYIFWLLLVFPIWFLWVQFPFRLKQKGESIAAVNLIATFLFTFVFMWFFCKIFFDFANDAATVFFRSEAVFPFIKSTVYAIFALIFAAIYLISVVQRRRH